MSTNYDDFKAEFDRNWERLLKIGKPVIELKSITLYPKLSEETVAFDATLYIAGKSVGPIGNRGHGGCDEYNANKAAQALSEVIEKESHGEIFDIIEATVAELINAFEQQKEHQRIARGGFSFRRPGDEEWQWRQVKWPKPVTGTMKLADKIALFERKIKDEMLKGCVALHPQDGRQVQL